MKTQRTKPSQTNRDNFNYSNSTIMEVLQLQFDFDQPIAIKTINEPQMEPSSKAQDMFVFEFLDLLAAPIITYSASWADGIPGELKEAIKGARLIAGLKKEETATIPEVVAYMITRTYEAPMSREWTNIYLWASAKYMKQSKRKTDEDLKEIAAPSELNEYEQSLLKKLRKWIYEQRRKYVKESMKKN